MRLLPYGDCGVLVDLDSTDQAMSWADAIAAAGVDGVEQVVPAARSVLVVGADPASIRQRLARLRVDGTEEETRGERPEIVEVPVVYDGEDLADVARHTGLGERDVVAAHTGRTWRVAFAGFAPGFAYLVAGDDRLRVPRRDEPRTRVPAGSVGLAGEYSGVYPTASPGGWQLIGRTALRLWDADRDPPALLRPGVRVRFVEER